MILSSPSAAKHRRTAVLASVVMMLATLGGCSIFSGHKKLDVACPHIGILRDANTVTLFSPGSDKSPTKVLGRGLVADFTGSCTYDETGVTIDLSVILIAERGPALTENQLPLTYFVALSNPENTIITKQQFATAVDFPTGRPRAGSREDQQLHLPLPEDQDARTYQVVLGFQLTPEQLAYNRQPQKH